MNGDVVQAGLAVFGIASLFMAMGHDERARRWAPLVGLAGQPFWLIFASRTNAWGLMFTIAAFSAVYAHGAWRQWKRPAPRELAEQPQPFDSALAADVLEEHERRCRLVLLAGRIADEAALSDILSNCPAERMGNAVWYDTARAGAGPGEPEGDEAEIEAVALAVQYLDMRGFMLYHPTQRHLVRVAK
jgi:hypothetical protein